MVAEMNRFPFEAFDIQLTPQQGGGMPDKFKSRGLQRPGRTLHPQALDAEGANQRPIEGVIVECNGRVGLERACQMVSCVRTGEQQRQRPGQGEQDQYHADHEDAQQTPQSSDPSVRCSRHSAPGSFRGWAISSFSGPTGLRQRSPSPAAVLRSA